MADHATSTGSLRCIVVTPETTVVDARAEFVTLTLADGEYGVAPQHAPMIGRLGYGELRIKSGNDTKRYYTDGGFVQVLGNVVSVLTNRAVPAAMLDKQTITDQLRAAQSRPAAGNEALAIRERLISQARGQLRVADATGTSAHH
jgi:F-type H+-transporting ATPase subunit epsilon